MAGSVANPTPISDIPQNPFLSGSQLPTFFERFDGMDTSASRPGIPDEKAYWLDGFFPLGNRNCRTVPGIGDPIYTCDIANGVSFFEFANLGATPIMIVAVSDGRLIQVNLNTGAATTIAPAGTIANPSRTTVGISQWGSKYVLISADQDNGYFVWDGAAFFRSGTIAPDISVENGGSGYASAPTVSVAGGGGSNASVVVSIRAGSVLEATVVNPGVGYTVGGSISFNLSGGGGSGASLSGVIMPFGIQGTALETYQSRVWVQEGEKISYTAPGSVTDFSTSNGGGSFSSTDSFLRVEFSQLVQSNGFLYLIADSSINAISGVSTSGTPPTTTFTNQNIDPEIGTPYGASVDVFSRNIVFANAYGAHVSYGGAVTKISRELDGFYASVPGFAGQPLSAAKAVIFGRKVWMVLVPVIDPVTAQQVNKLLVWDGRVWFVTSQDAALTFVAHQEINAVLTAYGTNGTEVFPLFQRPSDGFTKRIQTKLVDRASYVLTKTMTRLFGLVSYGSFESPEIRVTIDNENSSAVANAAFSPNALTWTNDFGQTMTWTNDTGQTLEWFSASNSISVLEPTAVGQAGVMGGLTIETESSDVTVVSFALMNDSFNYRG